MRIAYCLDCGLKMRDASRTGSKYVTCPGCNMWFPKAFMDRNHRTDPKNRTWVFNALQHWERVKPSDRRTSFYHENYHKPALDAGYKTPGCEFCEQE